VLESNGLYAGRGFVGCFDGMEWFPSSGESPNSRESERSNEDDDWKSLMSKKSSESLSYSVPETLVPRMLASYELRLGAIDILLATLLGCRYVTFGGGMKGDSGSGLGMYGGTLDTLSMT
jgi:hypothetical protein